MRKVLAKGLALAFVGSLFVAGSAMALPLFTESFETDPAISGFTEVGAGGMVGNFEVVAGTVDWVGDYWQASDGFHSLDMSGSSQGTVAKFNLDTIVGNLYEVTFDMAGNPDGPPDTKMMYAAVDPPTQVFNFTFDASSASFLNMGWETKTFDFVASATTTTLWFGDLSVNFIGGEFYGAALDNIIVNDKGAFPVPEPATMLLFGTGLVGLAGFGRRRAQKKNN